MVDILDKSVAELRKALPGHSAAELLVLKAAEEAGKTRAGALAAIDEALVGAMPGTSMVEVTNIVPGLDITMHDGSHLQFDETAQVPADLAAILRGREQVR